MVGLNCLTSSALYACDVVSPRVPTFKSVLLQRENPDAMPHAYTEDQLVEQAAIGLFAELGNQNAEHRPGTMEN